MTAENCLAGRACPECKQDEVLNLEGATIFEVRDDGVDEFHDVEWVENGHAHCPTCGWTGTPNDTLLENHPKPEETK